MSDKTKKTDQKLLSNDFMTFTFPIFTDETKFTKLMKDFSDAFEEVEFSSSNPSLFNKQYLKGFFDEMNTARDKISKLQSLIEIQTSKIASLFLNIQKNQIYEPILKNLIESKRKGISIIEQEIEKCETTINSMKFEHDSTTEELSKLKDEIDFLQSDTLFSLHEELMKINDSSIENAHQCISYQNELNKLENDISSLYPLINEKTENMKSLVLNQSSLRSKLAIIGSQISTITTDCATLTIDLENNTKKMNQGQINFHQKELELSTIENEIVSQSDRFNEIEKKISEKEEEIKNCQENMDKIKDQIQEFKLKIEQIECFKSDNSDHNEEEEVSSVLSIIQLQNKISELKVLNEKLLSEKDCLDQRCNQLEKIIDKKNQMIVEDKKKIEKKQLRYQELQEIFKLRKIMLLTAFDDINRKYDKYSSKIPKLEMQLKKQSNKAPIESEDSDISDSIDHEINESNKYNWNGFDSNLGTKFLANANPNSIQAYSQTPQIIRKFSKLFPKSNYAKNTKPNSKYYALSPSSQK